MAFKPRTRRILLWTTILTLASIAVAIVAIPPLVTLNKLKPKLEAAIVEQTGIPARITGNINFSLLGRATIVAHNLEIPNGTVDTAIFSIPLRYMFNISTAPMPGRITIYGAKITAQNLAPMNIKNTLEIHDSTVSFLGKDYTIIDGTLDGARFNGRVRTNQHKYEIDFAGDDFYIANRTNELVIIGRMTVSGGARGTMSFNTRDINRLFEFQAPKIDRPVSATLKFEWDGKYGFRFTDIRGDDFTGRITLYPNGARYIELQSDNLSFDFSFLLNPSDIFYDTRYNLDLNGNLTFAGRKFKHLRVAARGTESQVKIDKIIAGNTTLSGGTINADGAHNVMITTPMAGKNATCLFSGTAQNWQCAAFSYDGMTGKLFVTGDQFNLSVKSAAPMPTADFIRTHIKQLGRRGVIDFSFSDAAGKMEIGPRDTKTQFTFATNRTLSWMNMDWYFLPSFMRAASGDFTWDGNIVTFRPSAGGWMLSADGNAFVISGDSLKQWLPNLDLRSVRDSGYIISGRQNSHAISDLRIKIADHEFTGSVSGDAITLKTQMLNLDTFASQEFMDNIDEMEFLADAPLMVPFGINAKISLSADRMIYNGDEFTNFVYSLKPNQQTYSITDDARGSVLATIEKNKTAYNIFLQLNRFVTHGQILDASMPLNVRDATATAEINMKTHGQIAHDLKHNLSGDIDMTLTGGTIIGIGIDEFYATASNITTLNAEFALARALDGGDAALKKMHITGNYNAGDFKTTSPVELSLRHVDATGSIEIADGQMYAAFDLTMRGTSPAPKPIALRIMPDNTRRYSLSEIMMNFDAGFLREFISSHNRF